MSEESCLFCRIVRGELPTVILFEDEHALVFNDINPKAPQHKLIIPKRHITSLNELTVDDTWLIGHLTMLAQRMAKVLAVDDIGYRVVVNCNAGAGQTVYHLHVHLLAGRPLTWPPG